MREDVLSQAKSYLLGLRLPRRQVKKMYYSAHLDNWSQKVQNRKGTGTGRTKYLKKIPRVYKNQIKNLKS